MKNLTANKIRNLWLDFFKKYDHLELPSASLIPQDDDSLLWINSGVATLKPYFDGRLTPPSKYLVNSQKSIRTNDIENVGVTARHHTFFEMLGNFSIGGYFKKEAIAYAWEFLTSATYLAIAPEKLYITVFEEDQVSYDCWIEQGVLASHIIKGNRSTNFWDLGQGPCGPNSEVFYDRGVNYDREKIGLKLLKDDLENDRYIEIWNIVFSEFNNNGNQVYQDLPTKNIDTGAGLERIVALSQDGATNFDTDLFLPLIKEIEKYCNGRYDSSNYFTNDLEQRHLNKAFKVIADHIRTVTFAIADGALPGNVGRDYIIRRLIRRALRYGRVLEIKDIFLHRLVTIVIKTMSDYYPYLAKFEKVIINVIKTEENRFNKTLDIGHRLLDKLINDLKSNHQNTLNGSDAFKLYDTYGFPIELTKEIANLANILVDLPGFAKAQAQHRDLAKQSRKKTIGMKMQSTFFDQIKTSSKFVGYQTLDVLNAKAIFVFKDETALDEIDSDGCVIFSETPFYAEAGGQVADGGYITNADNSFYADVLDVQKGAKKFHLHSLKILKGKLVNGQTYELHVNPIKRRFMMANHSAVHLLFAALTTVLGHPVPQAGSLLNDRYLRFDFACNEKPARSVIDQAQDLANQWIKDKAKVEIIHTTISKARAMGALALEKAEYSQQVRVVKLGDYSLELCGGTHVSDIAEIQAIQVIHYDTKQSGVYRIEALTSYRNIKMYYHNKISLVFNQIRDLGIEYHNLSAHNQLSDPQLEKVMHIKDIKNNDAAGLLAINQLLEKYQSAFRKYKKRLLDHKTQALLSRFDNLEADLKILDPKSDTTYYHYRFQDITNPKVMQQIGQQIIKKHQNSLAFLITHNQKKQNIWAIFSGSGAIANGHLANNYAKAVVKVINGRGGGKPHMAMVSGENISFSEVLTQISKAEVQ